MTDVDPRLEQLGAALRTAAAAELAAAREGRDSIRRRAGRSTRAKVGMALAAAVLAVPAGAFAIGQLSPGQEVAEELAEGLPNGSTVMTGTEPTCTVLRRGIEYDCVLASLPNPEPKEPEAIHIVPEPVRGEPGYWRGYVIVTVDSSRHVNGGCRAENPKGTRWRCFLGEAAVRHKLVVQRFLGDSALGPISG
jgi:hypothetical protein